MLTVLKTSLSVSVLVNKMHAKLWHQIRGLFFIDHIHQQMLTICGKAKAIPLQA
jgi:hypothetical protein